MRGFWVGVAAVAAVAVLLPGHGEAASSSWIATSASTWVTSGNWDNGVPGSTTVDNTDVATFSPSLTQNRNVTVDAGRYIGGITFGNTTTFRNTLITGPLYLNNGGVIQTLSGMGNHTATITAPIRISGDPGSATFTAGATSTSSLLSIGAVTGSCTTAHVTTLTLNGGNTGGNVITGVISDGSAGGKLAIVKDGAGTWQLSGVNAFSGGLVVKAGTVIGGNSTSFGTSSAADSITLGDAATGADAAIQVVNLTATYANPIAVASGSGNRRIVNPSIQANSPTFSGQITLANGLTVENRCETATKKMYFSGGFTGTGNLTLKDYAAIATGGIEVKTGAVNFSGAITNSGTGVSPVEISSAVGTSVSTITQNSTNSVLTLSGANTFTGNIVVRAGTLKFGASTASANATSFNVMSNGVLDVSTLNNWPVGASQTLKGHGKMVGKLTSTIVVNGTLAPGDGGAGLLTVTNLTTLVFANDSVFAVEARKSTEYDRIKVYGGVNLGTNAKLSMSLLSGNSLVNGDRLFIVDNDGTDAVSGKLKTPAGTVLEEGDSFALGIRTFKVGYAGDSGSGTFTGGNDVVLEAVFDITPPTAPTRTGPGNGSSTPDDPPIFTWNTVTDDSGIARYDIRIDGVTNSAGGGTTFTPSALGLGAHTWNVRAVDGSANTGAWSVADWTVTIVSGGDSDPPPVPTLARPADESSTNDVTPTFAWFAVSDSSGVSRYDIVIDTTTNNASAATNYTPVSTLSLGPHTWKVRAVDGVGNTGEWSSVWTVTVVDTTAPAEPDLSSPSDGAHVATLTPTFTWSAVSDGGGIARYDIAIDAVTNSAGGVTTYTPAVPLSVASHRWRVRAVDNAANTGTWSAAWTVTVDPVTLYWDGDANGLPGGNGIWDSSTTANWNTAADLTGHHVTWSSGGEGTAWLTEGGGVITLGGTVNVSRVVLDDTVANNAYTVQGGTVRLTQTAEITRETAGGAALNGPSLVFASSASIMGSNGLSIPTRVGVTLDGPCAYTGDTIPSVNAKTLAINHNQALPPSTVVRQGVGALKSMTVKNGITATCAGVVDEVQVSGDANGTGVLVLSNATGICTWTGNWGNEFELVKRGAYTQVIGGTSASQRSWRIRVQGGVLALARPEHTAAIGNTRDYDAHIIVTGGSLRLDQSHQIQDVVPIALSGGTFDLNGHSETMSNLTVTASSTLDFGSGSATVLFAAAARTDGVLTVRNWNGKSGGGGADQFRVTALPSDDFLDHVAFAGHVTRKAIAADYGSYYEILPLPSGTIFLLR